MLRLIQLIMSEDNFYNYGFAAYITKDYQRALDDC